jgi:hypothetical protein
MLFTTDEQGTNEEQYKKFPKHDSCFLQVTTSFYAMQLKMLTFSQNKLIHDSYNIKAKKKARKSEPCI